MRISDWSSDVCSSDLTEHDVDRTQHGGDVRQHVSTTQKIHGLQMRETRRAYLALVRLVGAVGDEIDAELALGRFNGDRKSGVEGKSVSVRVDLGGRRIIKKKKSRRNDTQNQKH